MRKRSGHSSIFHNEGTSTYKVPEVLMKEARKSGKLNLSDKQLTVCKLVLCIYLNNLTDLKLFIIYCILHFRAK